MSLHHAPRRAIMNEVRSLRRSPEKNGRVGKNMHASSHLVAAAAIRMALTESREEEKALKESLRQQGILAAAVDYGGEAASAPSRIVERAVVAAKREGIIQDNHMGEGAVAGAAHEAFSQLATKAFGLSVGGKIGLARRGEHLTVALFFGIGLLNLDEVAVGLAHRAVSGC